MIKSIEESNQVISGFNIKTNLAPLHKRFFASIIDNSIVGAVLYLFFLVLIVVFGLSAAAIMPIIEHFQNPTVSAGIGILAIILMFLIIMAIFALYHGYFIYFEFKKSQTPGKKLFGLKVASLDGSRLTKKQCITRELFKWIDNFYVTALISIISTEKDQRIGDIVAGTYVIYSEHQEQSFDFIYMNQSDYDVFYHHLLPEGFEKESRNNYLAYANSRFILNTNEKNSDQYWFDYFDLKIARNENIKISIEDFLRFIAQYCYLKEIQDGNDS
jgi:uncharacterized RDD family membrane protein YckC